MLELSSLSQLQGSNSLNVRQVSCPMPQVSCQWQKRRVALEDCGALQACSILPEATEECRLPYDPCSVLQDAAPSFGFVAAATLQAQLILLTVGKDR